MSIWTKVSEECFQNLVEGLMHQGFGQCWRQKGFDPKQGVSSKVECTSLHCFCKKLWFFFKIFTDASQSCTGWSNLFWVVNGLINLRFLFKACFHKLSPVYACIWSSQLLLQGLLILSWTLKLMQVRLCSETTEETRARGRRAFSFQTSQSSSV